MKPIEPLDVLKAFADILDGNRNFRSWENIHAETGLSEERCKEIYEVCRAVVNEQVKLL